MRTSVFFILLATVAMPALAAAQDDEGRGDRDRGARSEQVEGKGDKSSLRAARSERSSSDQAAARQRSERSELSRAPRAEGVQQIVQSQEGSSKQYSGRRNRMTGRPADGGQPATVTTRDSADSVTNWRSRERRAARSGDSSTTMGSTDWGDRSRDGQTSATGTRSTTTRRWSGDWRRDDRYDWRRHRSRYSSLFRLGRYYDPYRYGYRRFSIGLFLGSGYYQNSNYWLSDPWQYRLPQAYGPYRWVRYYNDALLVDLYSGEVVDVIYGFFW